MMRIPFLGLLPVVTSSDSRCSRCLVAYCGAVLARRCRCRVALLRCRCSSLIVTVLYDGCDCSLLRWMITRLLFPLRCSRLLRFALLLLFYVAPRPFRLPLLLIVTVAAFGSAYLPLPCR